MLRLKDMPSWRAHQSKNKTKKQTQLAVTVLGILVLLIVLYQLINFFKFIHRPFNTQAKRNYTWDSTFNINVVLKTSPVSVLSYNPQDKKVTLITIPDETYTDVPGGFGNWQVRSIYDLGKMSKVSGDKLLEQSVSSLLGIPIDGFSSVDLLTEFRRNLFSGIRDLQDIQTDLTLWELVRLKLDLMGVRFDKINKVNLADLNVLEKQSLPDSTQVLIPDSIRLDSLSLFQDPQIQTENLSVSIFNATDRPLLAQRAKRIITNLGGNVVATQNAPRSIAKSYVSGQNSKTLERLHQIFSPSCPITSSKDGKNEAKCDKISPDDLGSVVARAQIVVVLGEDFP